jgi:hypothetical protein
VSSTDLENYANQLITSYNQTINTFFSDTRNDFFFYSDAYKVSTYISSQGGAGIVFVPSNVRASQNSKSDNPIGSAIFGGYPTPYSGLALNSGILVVNDYLISNLDVVNRSLGTAAYFFRNLTVIHGQESGSVKTVYPYVVLKGSNETDSWSNDQAVKDANEIFYNDLRIVFATSLEVKQRYIQPELRNGLLAIQAKFGNNSQVYQWSQWQADIQSLENLAVKNYHLAPPVGFIDELINYLNYKASGQMPLSTPTETPDSEPQTDYTTIAIVIAIVAVIALGAVAWAISRNKKDATIKLRSQKTERLKHPFHI